MSIILKKEPLKLNTSKMNSILNSSNLKSTKNKSLIDLTSTSIFQLSQQEVYFLNTQLNEIYEVSMFIRNVSDRKQQIRVKKPKISCLSISLNKDGIIAPGLDVKITISYDSKDNQRVQDYFSILSEDYECDVPIHVIPQAGKLQFQPFINFGFIKTGNTKEISWKIINKGTNLTSIQLVPSFVGHFELNIEPKNLVLQPKSEKQIKLKITSQQSGHMQGVIDIEPKLFSVSSIDFVANFCEYTRIISDDQGNQLTQITIEPLFCGQTVQVNANLVNNTPKSCQFRISRKKGCLNEEQNNLITPQQLGKDDSQKLISFTPSQGFLQAYESIPLITKIQANFSQSDQQLFCNYISGRINNLVEQKDLAYTVKAYINDEQNPLSLYIKSKCIVPKLTLSSTYLDFGETNLNDKKQKTLKIQNYSVKPVKIDFKNSPNFTFSQKSVKINSKASCYINVVFCPKIVGDLKDVSPMIVGEFSFPIKLLGKGVFNNKRTKIIPQLNGQSCSNNTNCQQVKVQDMDKTFLENEVSYINGQGLSNRKGVYHDQSNKSTIHFEPSYNDSIDQTLNGNSFYLTQHKKSKNLKDRNGKQVKITDPSSLNPNDQIQPYSSQPKNQQEERLINRQLTSDELSSIQVGPVVLDVGKIYLRSQIKKTFHICNFNSKPISIQLNTNNIQSFSQSSQERQVLPCHSWGGLLIKFQALKEGDFKYNLQYVINGKHFFEMMVMGSVIQPTLNLSKNQIKFFASQQDKSFQKKQTFSLINPYQYEVQFSTIRTQTNSLFVITPQNDRVPPNGSKNITITHCFDQVQQFGTKIQEVIKIKVTHGKTLQLKCLSMVPQCHCICKSQQINFKEVSIGKCYQNKIIIKNTSKNFTIYKIQLSKDIQNIITTSTTGGGLHAQQMQQIIFKIQAFSSMNIDSFVSFFIRGGKTIVLPLKALIITPKIKIQNQKIDFGLTPVEGNAAIKTVTLVNDSQIAIDLELRLPYDSYLCRSLKISKLMDQNTQIINNPESNKNNSSFKNLILRVNPKARSNIVLQFTPEQVFNYQFSLPLFLYNSNQPIPQLQKTCLCKGVKNRLVATQKQINFGKIIIEQNLQSLQKTKELQIRNPQQEAIDWWVDDSNIYPFSLQKSRGSLQANEKMSLRILFFSDVEGEYNKELKFFIDQGEKNENKSQTHSEVSHEYLKINIKATASYPSLYFDQPYVIMPIVNLGEQSKAAFQIINGGYQNINVKYMVYQQYSNVDLKVNFPQGMNLGVTKKKIKVEVSFKSQKPISFTIKINFYDTNNRLFSIPISGTSDNCIYTMIQNQRTVNYIEDQIDKSCTFLKHYINSLGCLEDSIYQFPRSIMENQFQKFHQFLCYFSSSFQKTKINLKKNQKNLKFFFNFDYLSQVIKNIKSQGGFLNHIRPQMLLPTYQEYLSAIKLRSNNNSNILSNLVLLDALSFSKYQKNSWVILIYQIFKVYSRVNCGKTKNSQFWSKFSARQKIILNWLQQAYLSESKSEYQKKKGVLEQLNDGEILSSIISKYTNIKILQVYGRQTKGVKQKERRIKNIIQTFSQIGINCHCRVEDMLRSNPKEMFLIVQGLYMILPSYLQKGEPILFNCALGQTITKSIQISNPSKFSINYTAKIDSPNKAFIIQNQTEFLIQSKSIHQVKVKYISNINLNNSSATLTLTGKSSSKFTPSTFIFVLKSQNMGRVSEKNIQVTGQLYQQSQFGINVQNNFQTDSQFKIQLISANDNQQTPMSFYCLSPSLKIRKGQAATVNVLFIPLLMETQKSFLVFKDQKVGQFQYQITGNVQQPQISLDVLKIPQLLYTNKKYSINLSIPTKNDNLLKAKKIIQALVQKYQKKGPKAQQNLNNLEKYYPKMNANQLYNVKITPSNQIVQLKSDSFYIKDPQNAILQNTQQQANKQDPKIQLDINMKMAAKQASFMLLIKNSSGTDVRRYKVLVNSIYKPLRYQLEMKTSMNKVFTQKLPLININNQANIFHVNLQTNELSKGIFNLEKQKQIIVTGKTTQSFGVSFKPKSQTTYNSIVKIQNVTTGQIIEYQITGVGEEPESQTLTFEQEIRKEKAHHIKLPIQRTAKCIVSKFTLQDAIYEKSFIINNSTNNLFKFKFQPKIPGTYEGKLIIEDQSKIYAFKIVVNARDVIQQEIKIKTIQRKNYKGQIPSVPQGIYSVNCTNNCFKFNKNFVSNQKNKGTFKFQHCSTKPEQSESFLIFSNEKFGQLTYLLKVKVQQMPQFKFEPFKTQLGSRHEETIKFNNNQNQPLKVNGICSHPKIFFFQPSTILVPPHSQFSAKLIYVPSKLQLQQGKVSFTSQRGEKWNYHMSGYGLLQSKPMVVQMRAQIGKQKIQSISFVNPLQKRLQATVELQSIENQINKEEKEPFQLILKNNKFQLQYLQQLILPIMLKPTTVKVSKAILIITLSQKIVFKYELVGIADFHFNQERFFRLSSRVKKQQTVTFDLPFLCKSQINLIDKAKLKIVSLNDNFKQLVKDSIKVIPKDKNSLEANKISFDICLKAFKPFKTTTHFMIVLPNGCKWVQKFDINFTTPVPDDKIEIISQMNKSSSLRFKLTNRVKAHAKFKAYFLNPSNQFFISPKNGELQPLGRQGTSFEIAFLPTIYKKQWSAKLIIQTQDSYWCYQIKGTLPPYLPPIAKSLINSSSSKKFFGEGARNSILKKSV